MPSAIRETADSILIAHKALGSKLESLLRPGLSNDEVSALTTAIRCRLPESVRELYSWRNGTLIGVATFGEMWLFPGWHMLSLVDAVNITK